jgi:hypothetical protein
MVERIIIRDFETTRIKDLINSIQDCLKKENGVSQIERQIDEIKVQLRQEENKLYSDVRIQINDSLKFKCEEKIQKLHKQLDKIKEDSSMILLTETKANIQILKSKINQEIQLYLEENNLNSITLESFNNVLNKVSKKKEFAALRSKIGSFSTTLNQIRMKINSSIVIRILLKEEKKYLDEKSGNYHKGWIYQIEDDTARTELIIWENQGPELTLNKTYAISNCCRDYYYGKLQIKVNGKCQVREL